MASALLVALLQLLLLARGTHQASLAGRNWGSDGIGMAKRRSLAEGSPPSIFVSNVPPSMAEDGQKNGSVAFCMTGEARDFELTGPSIAQRLLPAYPDPHLFLNAYEDAGSWKFHSLAWVPKSVTVALVRIVPVVTVDDRLFPDDILGDPYTPVGAKGNFLQFRIVESCIGLIEDYELDKGFRFDWIVRSRLDTYWAQPPPLITSYYRSSYTVPLGTDCLGINDRLGVGTWKTTLPALQRLSMLYKLTLLGKPKFLNSERSFTSILNMTRTRVKRKSYWFCIVSRRVYPRGMMPVFSLGSKAAINGAKCRPCNPHITDPEIVTKLFKNQTFRSPGHPGKPWEGLELCNAKYPWEDGWEEIFDREAGPILAKQRQDIMRSTFAECVAAFNELKERTHKWAAAPPEALCLRRYLGPTEQVGPPNATFPICTFSLPRNSVILTYGTVTLNGTSWEEALAERRRRTGLTTNFLDYEDSSAQASASGSLVAHVIKIFADMVFIKRAVESWETNGTPKVCQLVLGYKVRDAQHQEGQERQRWKLEVQLERLGFYLEVCGRDRFSPNFSCLFFSPENCKGQIRLRNPSPPPPKEALE